MSDVTVTNPAAPQVLPNPQDKLAWLFPGTLGDLAFGFSKPCPSEDKTSEEYQEWAAEVTQLAATQDAKANSMLGEVIFVRHVFAHPVLMSNEDAKDGAPEYTEGTRTVLIDADGYRIGMTSDFAIRGLQTVFQLFGHPTTWAKPVPIRIRQQETNTKGRRVFTLEVVRPSELKDVTTDGPGESRPHSRKR